MCLFVTDISNQPPPPNKKRKTYKLLILVQTFSFMTARMHRIRIRDSWCVLVPLITLGHFLFHICRSSEISVTFTLHICDSYCGRVLIWNAAHTLRAFVLFWHRICFISLWQVLKHHTRCLTNSLGPCISDLRSLYYCWTPENFSPWRANSCLASQLISSLLWKQEVLRRFHKSAPLVPKIILVYFLTSYFFKIYFNFLPTNSVDPRGRAV